MKKTLKVFLIIAVAVYPINLVFKRNDPAEGEPRFIDIDLRMSVKDFIEHNGLGIGPWVPQGYALDADEILDVSPLFFQDNWISLRVLDGDRSFELPPGRTLSIGQNAGRIFDFYFRPFAQPKPMDEIRPYLVDLVALLESKGWRPTLPVNIPSKLEDFDSGGKIIFAEMVSPSGNTLQLDLRDYGLAPRYESFILVLDPFHQPAKSSNTYLLGVSVSNYEDSLSYSDLIYPRRIFEKGHSSEALSLRP